MRKSQLTWDDVATPDWLKEMAEEVWQLLGVLTTAPHDEATQDRLDQIHADYTARYADAVALTFDHARAEATLAGREARDAQRGTVQQLRRDLEQARRNGGSLRGAHRRWTRGRRDPAPRRRTPRHPSLTCSTRSPADKSSLSRGR